MNSLKNKRLLISILLGLLGFVGSFYSLNYLNPPFSISIEWCDALPILAGMAFGGGYGLIAATLGLGAFYPLVLYPNNGWAAVVTSILLVFLYSAIGYFTELRRKQPAFWNHPLFIYPILALAYSIFEKIQFPIALSFNPPFWYPTAQLAISPSILDDIVVKGFFILILLIIMDDFLLKIPLIRKAFGLDIKPESRLNGWIGSATLIGSILLWVVVVIFNRIFIDSTFPQGLFQIRDSHEILSLVVLLPVGFLIGSIICRFVESRLMAENELEITKENYRQIFEQAADGIFIADIQGNYTDVNDSACKMTGYSRDEYLRMNMRDVVIADEMTNVPVRLSEVNAGGMIIFERRMRHKSGSTLFVEISARKLPDGRLQGLVRDVTRRKQAEEALRQSEENYRLIFDQSADGIFIVTENGEIIDVNASGCALLGYTRDEVLRRNIRDVIPSEITSLMHVRREEMKNGRTVVAEQQVIRKDGSRVDVEMTGQQLPDGRFQGIVRDITSRKQVEEKVRAAQVELERLLSVADESRLALLSVVEDQKEAEEKTRQLNIDLERRVQERTAQLGVANRELEAFAYSVSHDLRAPLRAVDGFSRVLLSDYSGQLDEQGLQYLHRIQEASLKMGELISDLLDLSRVTRAEINYQTINLSGLARDLIGELIGQALGTKALGGLTPSRKVDFDIAENMTVMGDGSLIKIALENLLNNAIKFTGKRDQAVIQVGVKQQNGECVYFVRDNGTGFNMAYAGKLFTPFQRLHSPVEFPGSGIGLSIVQRIITRHGGRIWPESEPGVGTTFYFTLGEGPEPNNP